MPRTVPASFTLPCVPRRPNCPSHGQSAMEKPRASRALLCGHSLRLPSSPGTHRKRAPSQRQVPASGRLWRARLPACPPAGACTGSGRGRGALRRPGRTGPTPFPRATCVHGGLAGGCCWDRHRPGAGARLAAMKKEAARRYQELLREVRRHDHLYYVEARPEISDAAYDRLYRELQDLEKSHPDLADENSPTKKVGGTPLDSFRTVRHAVPMQSLNNTYSEGELQEFLDRVAKNLHGQAADFCTGRPPTSPSSPRWTASPSACVTNTAA
ncbi:MAG: hypothetical protein EBS49_04305 [Verrucomicrobia bacterium]|nr:hypothetical protein [Verrucomicrobiota bacterium]